MVARDVVENFMGPKEGVGKMARAASWGREEIDGAGIDGSAVVGGERAHKVAGAAQYI